MTNNNFVSLQREREREREVLGSWQLRETKLLQRKKATRNPMFSFLLLAWEENWSGTAISTKLLSALKILIFNRSEKGPLYAKTWNHELGWQWKGTNVCLPLNAPQLSMPKQGGLELRNKRQKRRMCWLIEKIHNNLETHGTAQSWRTPKVRRTRRRRREAKSGGDERGKKRTETSNTAAARTVDSSPSPVATTKIERRREKCTEKKGGERRPSQREQADVVVKCEGSKGDEERSIKQ